MPHPGKVPLEKITLSFPADTLKDVRSIVSSAHRWISEADFIRHAVANEVQRYQAAGHRLPEGPGPADLVDQVRARATGSRPRKSAP